MRTNLTYYRPETLRPVLEHLSFRKFIAAVGPWASWPCMSGTNRRLPANKELAAALIPLLKDADQAIRNRSAGRVGEDAPGSGDRRPETDSLAGRRIQDDPLRRGRRFAQIGPPALPAVRPPPPAALILMFVPPRCLASAPEVKPVRDLRFPLLISLATDADDMVRRWAVAALGETRPRFARRC